MQSKLKISDWAAVGEAIGGAYNKYQENDIRDRAPETVQSDSQGMQDYEANFQKTGDVGQMTDQGLQYKNAAGAQVNVGTQAIAPKTQYKLGDKVQDQQFTPEEVTAQNDTAVREFWTRAGAWGANRQKNADETEARGLQLKTATLGLETAQSAADSRKEIDAVKGTYTQLVDGLNSPEGLELFAAFSHAHPNEFDVEYNKETNRLTGISRKTGARGEIDVNSAEGMDYLRAAVGSMRDSDLAALDPEYRKQLLAEQNGEVARGLHKAQTRDANASAGLKDRTDPNLRGKGGMITFNGSQYRVDKAVGYLDGGIPVYTISGKNGVMNVVANPDGTTRLHELEADGEIFKEPKKMDGSSAPKYNQDGTYTIGNQLYREVPAKKEKWHLTGPNEPAVAASVEVFDPTRGWVPTTQMSTGKVDRSGGLDTSKKPGAAPAPAAGGSTPTKIKTKEEYAKLAPGTQYIDPNGVTRTKGSN